MGYNSGIVTMPVSIRDVQNALGDGNTDLGTLCKSDNINKWSWYKPVDYAKIGVITENERKSVHYGLSPVSLSYMLSMLRGDISHSNYSTEWNNAKGQIAEWIYTKPNGGASSPYRLTDFVESPYSGEGRGSNGSYTNAGYYGNTPPPLRFGDVWEIGLTSLQDAANNKIAETGADTVGWWCKPYTNVGTGNIGSGSAVKGTYCYEGLRYADYGARFGTASNENINMNNTWVIPLNFLLSSTMMNEQWRLGLVVYVKGISGNNIIPSDVVDFFTSQYCLGSVKNDIASAVQQFSIDMITNQNLAYKMAAYVQSKGTTDFDAIPVIVKFTNSTINGGGVNARTFQLINGANATFYSLPTGDKSFRIRVNDSSIQPPSGDEKKTVGNWTIKKVFTGVYTGNSSTPSSQRYPINNIIVYWSGSGTPSASTVYNIVTSFYWQMYDGALSTGTTEHNIEYGGNATVTINNVTYYGRILRGGPNLVMPDQNQISLSVTTS